MDGLNCSHPPLDRHADCLECLRRTMHEQLHAHRARIVVLEKSRDRLSWALTHAADALELAAGKFKVYGHLNAWYATAHDAGSAREALGAGGPDVHPPCCDDCAPGASAGDKR